MCSVKPEEGKRLPRVLYLYILLPISDVKLLLCVDCERLQASILTLTIAHCTIELTPVVMLALVMENVSAKH